jgi:DNA-3-methyladenine glycosylase I
MKPELRCPWAGSTALYQAYHDQEWGVPVRDDRMLFEMLVLEGAQAGLSWLTILKKRENYRIAFDGFDPAKIAGYDANRVARLLVDVGIVRNRLKIAAAISNARAALEFGEPGAFSAHLWGFAGDEPKQNHWNALADLPARTPESDAMGKDLAKRGFRFVGPTICYAFMQAVGMVNDHLVTCPRHREVALLTGSERGRLAKKKKLRNQPE